MSRKKTVVRATILKIVAIVVQVAATLILVPALLTHFGDTIFGLWTLVTAIASYFVLLDLGTTHAVHRYGALAVGGKDDRAANSVISNGICLSLGFSVLSIGVVLLAAGLIGRFLEPELAGLGRTLLLILGIEFAVTLPLRSLQSVLTANLAHDRIAVYQMFRTVFRTVGMLLVLQRGLDLPWIALVHVLSNLLLFAISALDALRNYPWARPRMACVSRSEMIRLFRFGWFIFLAQFGDVARLRLDSLVISWGVGLSSVTTYALASRITEQWSQVVAAFTGTVKTIFAQDVGAGRPEALRSSYFSALRITTLVSLFVGANLIVFGEDFLVWWIGETYVESYSVLVILSLGFAAALSQSVGVGLLHSAGRPRAYAYLNLAEAAANLVLSLLLVHRFGVLGVAVGTTVPMLASKLIAQPLLVGRCLGTPMSATVAHLRTPVVFTITFYLLVYGLLAVAPFPHRLGIGALLMLGSAACLGFVVLSIRIVLNARERDLLWRISTGKAI